MIPAGVSEPPEGAPIVDASTIVEGDYFVCVAGGELASRNWNAANEEDVDLVRLRPGRYVVARSDLSWEAAHDICMAVIRKRLETIPASSRVLWAMRHPPGDDIAESAYEERGYDVD